MENGIIEKLGDKLLTVRKPGRYIGNEWNMIKKPWRADTVKVALCFPDVYEIGMSYLGLKILYGALNERDDALCERVFAPWPDMEKLMRDEGIPLFGLESGKPVSEFDIVGFSLAYELNYTNAVNMLDMAGIPIRSSERTGSDPLIVAGGPSCCNPEPMAAFIDLFVIGEGEEVIMEIVDAYKAHCARHGVMKRDELLGELASVVGVYVPSAYSVAYGRDGAVLAYSPSPGAPSTVRKRVVADFETSYYPTKQIVPNIQVVHDRISLEIMRGCRNFCKFCQATAACSPNRERSLERIVELAKRTYAETGYDEISLVSLSSGDHSKIKEIVRSLNDEFSSRAVSIALPSLRIEDVISGIPNLVANVKKSGLTFAVESGSVRLRNHINKNIDVTRLYAAAEEAYRMGWKRVKLYFMIGLPSETDEDVIEILDVIQKVSAVRKKVDGHPAPVTASISSFIPKPHTPFHREAMAKPDELKRKKILLLSEARKRRIKAKMDFHDLDKSFLEAVFSRGDRRLADVIQDAWRKGARFDSWDEFFDKDRWMRSFEAYAIDPGSFVFRARGKEEVFPWGVIAVKAK
ncbi:MAG: TIGR03960 family B12-binding radical SAM protein [Candidatus Omnitrophota bacterium]